MGNIVPPGGGGGTTSPLTTKGDVWGFTSTDARVPIGGDGDIATVDSGEPAGWAWGRAPASPVSFSPPYIALRDGSLSGPVGLLTAPPAVSDLTWVNQGGATASNVGAGNAILMKAPGSSGDSLRYLHTSAYPTTPYTFTMGMKLMCLNADFQIHGIAISDGTKFAGFGMGRNGTLGATAYTFATATSSGVTIGAIPFTALLPSAEWYVSLTDDGTTITIKQGPDPLNMLQIGAATRATLGLTPTQIGVFLDPNNTNFPAQAMFFHWLFT